MEYKELDFETLYYLTRQGSYANWKVVQVEPTVVNDTLYGGYYEIEDNTNKVTQVFPTEITKVVYLPKELT